MELNRRLIDQGLKIHNVPADVNCQFSALAIHLTESAVNKTHKDVRREVVEYLSCNPNLVSIIVSKKLYNLGVIV